MLETFTEHVIDVIHTTCYTVSKYICRPTSEKNNCNQMDLKSGMILLDTKKLSTLIFFFCFKYE